MNTYQSKEYHGTILPPFDPERRRESKNGWYLDFIIESTEGSVIPCRVFQEVYEAASNVLAAGRKVALFGYLSGGQLRVKVARDPEKPAVTKHLAFNGQNSDEVKKEFQARVKEMAKRGIVPVQEKAGVGWYPLSYTVKDKGAYKLKVEWAIERLGAKHVCEKLRAASFVELNGGKARVAGNFQRLYLEMLDGLVAEAKELDALEF
jgi:hypothetical protein